MPTSCLTREHRQRMDGAGLDLCRIRSGESDRGGHQTRVGALALTHECVGPGVASGCGQRPAQRRTLLPVLDAGEVPVAAQHAQERPRRTRPVRGVNPTRYRPCCRTGGPLSGACLRHGVERRQPNARAIRRPVPGPPTSRASIARSGDVQTPVSSRGPKQRGRSPASRRSRRPGA